MKSSHAPLNTHRLPVWLFIQHASHRLSLTRPSRFLDCCINGLALIIGLSRVNSKIQRVAFTTESETAIVSVDSLLYPLPPALSSRAFGLSTQATTSSRQASESRGTLEVRVTDAFKFYFDESRGGVIKIALI